MTFKLPSLLQVRGEDDSGPQVWYAEAVGKISKNGQKFYEGYYLVPGDRPDHLVYDENYELIPEDSVMRILPVKTGYRSAWHMMGFVMRDDNTFYKIGEPMTDSGSEECFSDDEGTIDSQDSYSTATDCSSNVSNLVDDTEIGGAWPRRCEDVEAFDAWVPETDRERDVKEFLDHLHHRAAVEFDNINF